MSSPTTQADHYVIRIEGYLAPRWAGCLAGWTLTCTAAGETVLAGTVENQAALYEVLAKVRDLNLVLVAVERIE